MPVPKGFSMIDAAATPETLMTVWHNVFERGGLKPGETLLIHGGSSGIGTTAIQMAKAHGAKVIVTVGSQDKCDACLKLGADVAINYKTEDFVAKTKAATNDVGANVILDMVGGDYIDRNYDAAAIEGRIVQIAFLGGPKASPNFAKLMIKRLHHTGSTLRPRSNEDKAAMVTAINAKVLPWIAEGRLKPLMDSTFPLKEASKAHARMEIEPTYWQNCAHGLRHRNTSKPFDSPHIRVIYRAPIGGPLRGPPRPTWRADFALVQMLCAACAQLHDACCPGTGTRT